MVESEGIKDDVLSKLASRAKRKLNKQILEEREQFKKCQLENYVYMESGRKEAFRRLEKKVTELLKKDPDCMDPIGRLIDHNEYDNLSENAKEAYVLKLSQEYSLISDRFKKEQQKS